MDHYMAVDDSGRLNRSLLSTDSSDFSSSSSSSLPSFSPLPPSLHKRLFPPTILARVLWAIAIFVFLALVLLIGYEIGKRLVPTTSPDPPSTLSSTSSPSPPFTVSSSPSPPSALSSTSPPPPPPTLSSTSLPAPPSTVSSSTSPPSTLSSTGLNPPSSPSRVVLISIDGFRASYLDSFATQLPTLRSMRWNGASAGRMISCYPSVTFPNHWSVVTGLYTPYHGIISNTIFDPVFNATFNMQTLDSRWWQGEPVWNTAMMQGKKANILFWPGSEVEVQGMRPNIWVPYSQANSYNNSFRISTVLSWLKAGSCDLCVSYFDLVDGAGHSYGPASTQVGNALATVDSLIAQLLQGIYDLGLDDVTVILTSDHGMAAINSSARSIVLDDYTDVSAFRLIDMGATLGIWPYNLNDTTKIYNDLYGKVDHLTVLDPAKAEAMHYAGNRRIPPIVGMADDGWVVRTRARPYNGAGTHGYDPRVTSMGALFLGQGKGLKRGGQIKEVENVNVYSLICHLLGIQPTATNGTLEVWKDILA